MPGYPLQRVPRPLLTRPPVTRLLSPFPRSDRQPDHPRLRPRQHRGRSAQFQRRRTCSSRRISSMRGHSRCLRPPRGTVHHPRRRANRCPLRPARPDRLVARQPRPAGRICWPRCSRARCRRLRALTPAGQAQVLRRQTRRRSPRNPERSPWHRQYPPACRHNRPYRLQRIFRQPQVCRRFRACRCSRAARTPAVATRRRGICPAEGISLRDRAHRRPLPDLRHRAFRWARHPHRRPGRWPTRRRPP